MGALKLELSTLERFNSWWKTDKVRLDLLEKYRRIIFHELKKYIPMRQLILIYGLRRVGKTTLLYQIINDLLLSVDSVNILYFSFDEKNYGLDEIFEVYQNQILHSTFEDLTKQVYIFIDEIQKLDDWESKLKIYYDLYPKLKIILTGSASIQLRKHAKESLAGRIFSFDLEPLHFYEFLEMHEIDAAKVMNNPGLWTRTMQPLFDKYIKSGSFPELANITDENIAKKYIAENVVEKILYKDIPAAFKITDIELLKTLLDILANNPGMLVDYASLSQNLKRDQRTISNYFKYLEFGLLIKFVFNYRGSVIASAKKLKKVYLATPNISFALGDDTSQIMPKMLENIAMLASGAKFFYRNSFEVDFIIKKQNKLIGIEVKSNSKNPRQLLKFKEKFGDNVSGLLLLSNSKEEIERVKTIPIWQFLLESEVQAKQASG